MSELKPIKVTDLPDFEYSDDMYVLVSKKVGDVYVSGKLKLSSVACGCSKEPEPPTPPVVDPPVVEPDKYEDLPKNARNVFHSMVVRGYGSDYQLKSGLSELDYDSYSIEADDREGGKGYYLSTNQPPYLGAVGTYPVIDVDEISVFAVPMRTHTGINTHGSFCNGLDVRTSDIVRVIGFSSEYKSYMLRDWDNLIGGYYAWGHAEIRGIFFPRNFQIFDKREDGRQLLSGYDVIKTEQLLQMIGQAPQDGNDLFTNIRDFLFTDNDPYYTGSPLNQGKNISGLNFYAAGDVQNSGSHNTRPCNIRDFGKCFTLATKRDDTDQVYLTRFQLELQIREIASTRAFAHGGNLRYARTKTTDELGYKLVIDGDSILMVDVTDTRENIPVGCLRGVALRYANRAERIITKSYSEIVSEAAQITALFSVNANV